MRNTKMTALLMICVMLVTGCTFGRVTTPAPTTPVSSTPEPSPTATNSPTPTREVIKLPTKAPTDTPVPTEAEEIPTPTDTEEIEPTEELTGTPEPTKATETTEAPTPTTSTPVSTKAPTATSKPTNTPTPTKKPTSTPTPTPTPVTVPGINTPTPTEIPTPTLAPTSTNTPTPTIAPTIGPEYWLGYEYANCYYDGRESAYYDYYLVRVWSNGYNQIIENVESFDDMTPDEIAMVKQRKAEDDEFWAEARRSSIDNAEKPSAVGPYPDNPYIDGLHFFWTNAAHKPIDDKITPILTDSSTWYYFDRDEFFNKRYGYIENMTWAESKFNGWTAEQIFDYAFGKGAFQNYLNTTVKQDVTDYITRQNTAPWYCALYIWKNLISSDLTSITTPGGRFLGTILTAEYLDAIIYEWDFIEQRMANAQNYPVVSDRDADGNPIFTYPGFVEALASRYQYLRTSAQRDGDNSSGVVRNVWYLESIDDEPWDLSTAAGWRLFISQMHDYVTQHRDDILRYN